MRPNGLDFELVHTLLKFLRENPGTAVVLDDLDYLATLAGFDAVARFLKRVANQASASRGTVIVAAGVGTFTAEQFAILRGSVDRVLEIVETPGPSSSGPTDHVLLTIPAEDVATASDSRSSGSRSTPNPGSCACARSRSTRKPAAR